MSYIQIAIRKVKAVDLDEMRALKKKGHKSIRFKLEEIKGKRPTTASVPLSWIIESRERHVLIQDDKAFSDFVSDWISGWI